MNKNSIIEVESPYNNKDTVHLSESFNNNFEVYKLEYMLGALESTKTTFKIKRDNNDN